LVLSSIIAALAKLVFAKLVFAKLSWNVLTKRRNTMQKRQNAVRWYERERWRYAADRKPIYELADWVSQIDWRLFGTFTFAWKVNDYVADRIYVEFINRLEQCLKSDVGYVRGDEKRFSGCGQPACARHFHVLLTSAAPLAPAFVEELWMSMAGNRADGAGAQVKPYDPTGNAALYVLKSMNKVEGDWKFGKFELFHPLVKGLQIPTKGLKRHLRRHKARQQKFGSLVPWNLGGENAGNSMQ
jgi:hypothetical protein